MTGFCSARDCDVRTITKWCSSACRARETGRQRREAELRSMSCAKCGTELRRPARYCGFCSPRPPAGLKPKAMAS